MQPLFTERLLKFAKHISSVRKHKEEILFRKVNLVILEQYVHSSFTVTCHDWIFQELPNCFTQWYYDEVSGEPIYDGAQLEEEDISTVSAAIDWFGLTPETFAHIFDLNGFQDTKNFGGNKLNMNSSGTEIAYNIFELVEKIGGNPRHRFLLN